MDELGKVMRELLRVLGVEWQDPAPVVLRPRPPERPPARWAAGAGRPRRGSARAGIRR
jgi:hypothetical protein